MNESFALDMVSDVEEYSTKKAKEIEVEIERMGVVLGVDWENDSQVLALATESLQRIREDCQEFELHHDDYQLKARMILFALANMMMELMANSAWKGVDTHGGPAWKAFSRALQIASSNVTNS